MDEGLGSDQLKKEVCVDMMCVIYIACIYVYNPKRELCKGHMNMFGIM